MVCGALVPMTSWPSRKAANAVTSPTTSATAVNTTALTPGTGLGVGTAARLTRIMPEPYSEVMIRTPRTAMASWAM